MRRSSRFLTRSAVACAILLLPDAAPLRAQSPAAEPMRALDFLVGTWTGEGWIAFGPGERQTFRSTETIKPMLDGSVLLVEGDHHGRIPGGTEEIPVHQALGILFHDPEAGIYRFSTWVAGRGHDEHEARLIDGAFVWGFRNEEQGTDLRFTIRLTEDGRWHEVGEASRDGETWNPFFEMTLERAGS